MNFHLYDIHWRLSRPRSSANGTENRLKPSLPDIFRLKEALTVALFITLVLLAAAIRWWAAPISAGPDIAQFWAFARVFQLHGLNFYQYADASGNIFPFKYWAYVYPSPWLLILRICLFAVPGAQATNTMVDAAWRLAVKVPIILADMAIGCLLFWTVPGSKTRKLLFASLWLFHPTVWYNSAVFGQFDALAAVFVFASIIALVKQKYGNWLAFLLAGLAVTIKQHTLIIIAGMMAGSLYNSSFRSFLKNGIMLALPFVAFSIPFVLDGNLIPYARAVFLPAQAAAYQYPLDFAFSGTGSLLTHLHNVYGWNTENLLRYTAPVTALVLVAVLICCYWRKASPVQAALASFLVFVALFYRINYQYLVIYIPVALLAAAMTRYKGERIMTLVLALFPAVWLWLYDVTFWFTYLSPASPWIVPYFDKLGLAHRSEPYVYVIFAVTLMCLSLAYIILVLTRWNQARSGKEWERGQVG